MGKVLTLQARSLHGHLYTVEIHDIDTTVDSTDEADITARCSWSYTGKEKTIYQDVIPLQFSLSMNVPGPATPEGAFAEALRSEGRERRYWIKCIRGAQETFRGWIDIDQLIEPVRSQEDYWIDIKASDSLGKLGKYDYIDPDDTDNPYRGTVSIREHLRLILKSADIDQLYADGEDFLYISTSYHSDKMPNNTDDYTSRMMIDHRHFASEVEEEFSQVGTPGILFIEESLGLQPVEPGKSRDALDQLCFTLNAFFFHAYGRYYFISRERMLASTAVPYFRYDRVGTLLGQITETEAYNIGSKITNDTGVYLLDARPIHRYDPAIKQLIIDHERGGGSNKLQGAEWSIQNHEERCFDNINNQGNATATARFVFRVNISYFVNLKRSRFRLRYIMRIKIGSYYLVRQTVDTVFDNDSVLWGQEIEYTTPVWQNTPGDFEVVIDTVAGPGNTRFDDEVVTIVDVDIPLIPESGELCIDVDFVEMRLHDPVVVFFDARWDTVNFLDDETIEEGGDQWKLDWLVHENFFTINSDDAEDNESTRSFRRYTAEVFPRNTQSLEFSTSIGDDPGTNTHGRLQIDRSAANDGSDIVDSSGGWTLHGAGTVYENIVELLAWDMSRLRVGVARYLKGTIRNSVGLLYPHTSIIFDGKRSIMATMRVRTDKEDHAGTWVSIEDIDNTVVKLSAKRFAASSASDPREVVAPLTGSETREYIHRIDGITTDRIQIPLSKPLPSPADHSTNKINQLFKKALRGNANQVYDPSLSNRSHFSIDITTNQIILADDSKADIVWYYTWEL